MATPALLKQTANVTFALNNAGSVRINTFNANGTPLDVHTGYTVQSFNAQPLSSPNAGSSGVALASDVTPVFDTTGVTLSWTAAQVDTLIAALQSTANVALLTLSNDSGTTRSIAAQMNLQVDPIANSLG